VLCISRKVDEEIVIGNVRVLITKLNGSRVWLGIEAPADVKILRGELVEEKQRRIFTNCNVCGIALRTDAEDEIGMCEKCAGE